MLVVRCVVLAASVFNAFYCLSDNIHGNNDTLEAPLDTAEVQGLSTRGGSSFPHSPIVDILSELFRLLSSLGPTPPPLEGSCCRRRPNCMSVRERVKCFTNVVNRRRETCCPVSPGFPELYVANCACRCRRVFTSRTFWALCSRNMRPPINVRRFTQNLATSCSCGRG